MAGAGATTEWMRQAEISAVPAARGMVTKIQSEAWIEALIAQRFSIHAAAVGTAVLAAIGAVTAHHADRPITAAILSLLGVTIVGGFEGVAGGLIAALLASAAYNFFLAEPVFRFSLSSIEDLVPLIAFNASAVASGFLAGRLKDRARAAETANRRLEALLHLSHGLQSAFNIEQVLTALNEPDETQRLEFELYLVDSGSLEAVGPHQDCRQLAERLCETGLCAIHEEERSAFLLLSASEPIGVLVASACNPKSARLNPADAGAIANLVSIAAERCLLLRKVSEAEIIRTSEAFKTALLSSVSHDMRTPLGAISASASSLARYGAELPESARADMLNMIQEQCARLDRYTANLLGLSRLQAGLDQDRFSPCDAVEALGSAITQVRRGGHNHEFIKRFEATEALVRADPVMLEQIFYNVLENAVRYSEPATPITISCATRGAESLCISIRDVGKGVRAEEATRVFDRFYRAGDSHSWAGTGLGLSIAKGFTEAFGGRIWIDPPSDALGGTIVMIELPLLPTSGEVI